MPVWHDGHYCGNGEVIPMTRDEFIAHTASGPGYKHTHADGSLHWETKGTPRVIGGLSPIEKGDGFEVLLKG